MARDLLQQRLSVARRILDSRGRASQRTPIACFHSREQRRSVNHQPLTNCRAITIR
jgi:hypothetical protein